MTTRLLDIPVHAVDYTQSLRQIASWVDSKKRPSAYITQTNVYSLVIAQKDERCREALTSADLSLPDGMPLVWLLRLKGSHVVSRIYGPDLMKLVSSEAAKRGWCCFLYGGKPEVLDRLKETLEVSLFAKYPHSIEQQSVLGFLLGSVISTRICSGRTLSIDCIPTFPFPISKQLWDSLSSWNRGDAMSRTPIGYRSVVMPGPNTTLTFGKLSLPLRMC